MPSVPSPDTPSAVSAPAAKRLRLLASAVSVLLVAAILLVGWLYFRIRASLPQLDGNATVAGLSAAVTIERDAQGVPMIRGSNRVDVSRALGWLHGQDRFFQMDLMRRSAAGELSELLGERALSRDRANRIHGFRRVAQRVVEQLPADKRALLEAYVAGVNAGVAALGEKPFEYIILREEPQPWRLEDSILVIHSMALDLQGGTGNYERSLVTLRDKLGLDALKFFAPVITPDDAALDGTQAPLPAIPGPRIINLRNQKVGSYAPATTKIRDQSALAPASAFARDSESGIGSNAFALAGAHTASGTAMLANDMHLDLRVPNTWYRAAIEYSGRTVVGVTLPGAPAIVAGSNGDVAWGFTNAYIDTSDLVAVQVNSLATFLYTAPGHETALDFEQRNETIQVKGDDAVPVEQRWTLWGPVIATDDQRRPLALRWVTHDPEATNLDLLDMEQAKTVNDGIAIAHRAGIPAQNIILADRAGDIAWTIAGRVPKRVGYDGRVPVSWAFGDRKWDGYLSPAEIPVVRGADTEKPGRLWSANQRHVGAAGLAQLGDGAYRRSYRAAQIRDGIARLEQATPKDLLAVQLDDRALFLERWHALLMKTLTPAATADSKPRTALRSYAEKWEGRASVDAVSYWLVRDFRIAVHALIFTPIFEKSLETFPEFDWREFQLEPASWELLQQRPLHLLNPRFETWDELLLAACDDVIKISDRQGISMTKATWGWRNTARIRHLFSYSFPWVSGWFDLPADPLPGGDDMPRVQSSTNGASQRMVVSPGREHEGILHVPGGQSGHPLSPHYRAGHEAWVRGEPTPLLPGKPATILRLQP